jgi:hypothetical protein
MSTTIATIRATLAGELRDAVDGDDVFVSASWPDTIRTPCIFLTPPLIEDYVRRGPNFGEHTVGMDIVIAVDENQPVDALTELERLLVIVLKNTADWQLVGVDSPAPTTVVENGLEYLACVVHLNKPAQL